MSNKVKFSLVGFNEIQKKLQMLNQEVRFKASRSALRRSAGIVMRSAKENALTVDDKKTGRRIADNIALRFGTKVFNSTGKQLYRIGVNTRWQNTQKGNPDEGYKGNTPHWHLVEFGTRRSRERKYLRPALTNNVNNVINKFGTEIMKEINKLL
ncbi:HK97 gp10 family phage protein [Alishewanella sp. 16-MA]|uniref:HK97 gp10 family phage protein n=1 Tax=Alishewanella maricola TaxID=2795740 RepID=A0ABS8C1K0_9ALTE|nr:HK97-gp10 family putative phage morphogenesis protein [Alishewanella maricola]MCB5226202.1 HK97 gp10 family phage protein [Alishewanella maricola]